MSGRCVDNPRIGIIGCGATYGGEMQHSVAKVSWSIHPDGRAHITAALGIIDKCWQTARRSARSGEMADPRTLGLHQGADGRWHRPGAPDTGFWRQP